MKHLKTRWLTHRKTRVFNLCCLYFWWIRYTRWSIFTLEFNLTLRKIRKTSPALHAKIRRIFFIWQYLFPISGIGQVILSWASDVQVCTISSIQFLVFLLWWHTNRSFHYTSRTLLCNISLFGYISYNTIHLYVLDWLMLSLNREVTKSYRQYSLYFDYKFSAMLEFLPLILFLRPFRVRVKLLLDIPDPALIIKVELFSIESFKHVGFYIDF
jgi:hypothetical protein